MKTSTVLTTVLLSASCFAAPVRTAQDAPATRVSVAAPHVPMQADVPVAPPAPDVPVSASTGPQRWEYLTIPKSHRLDKTLSPDIHQQT
ncbi:hypothetical protein [Paraburkholderia acidisoli]|uniref:Uncharacterized protein n=1 Tax=Paraburkholderia acidisoli TaxID=2571748 RepID=A0A7Z2GGJ8_9BURK|nr:hypothetical protein [Paraburkholderia acidisoli]QGZ61425.1 hypothetical protein FAZ98_06590 [Paraburkholderia acidisoli]